MASANAVQITQNNDIFEVYQGSISTICSNINIHSKSSSSCSSSKLLSCEGSVGRLFVQYRELSIKYLLTNFGVWEGDQPVKAVYKNISIVVEVLIVCTWNFICIFLYAGVNRILAYKINFMSQNFIQPGVKELQHLGKIQSFG